ncbi:MAG: hypothetical protein ACK4LB_08000 [Spirosomataceae bacterium]
MSKKIVLFISPLILFLELYTFSWIAQLLRQPSDAAVFGGILLLCAAVVANYFLIQYIQNQFKQTIK